MDRSKDTYEMIKKNIVFEGRIRYQRETRKECLGCLVKSKYADESDNIEFLLYETKSSRGPFLYLNLIDYDHAEKLIELRKGVSVLPILSQRKFYSFGLRPKFQQEKEIFFCETDELRTKWLKTLNEWIDKLTKMQIYSADRSSRRVYEGNFSDQIDPIPSAPVENEYEEEIDPILPPPRPPKRNLTKHLSSNSNFSNESITTPKDQRPVPILPVNSLSEDEYFFSGTLNQLQQFEFSIFKDADRPGVFAVMRKTNPDPDCLWAIRVFEHRDELISSWNIYHNSQTNKFSLCDRFETSREFSTIEELCLFYMKNDLPGESVVVSRLMLPYRRL